MTHHLMSYQNPQRRERLLNLAEHRRPKQPAQGAPGAQVDPSELGATPVEPASADGSPERVAEV
jgi:hypothetical protein